MTAPAPRRQGLGPFVAAAVVALVVVAGVVFWPRDSKTTPDSIACPKTFPAGSALWVPAKAHTTGPGKALVPSTLPEKGVVCGYVAPSAADTGALALTGSKKLVGDPRAVVSALRAVPKASGGTACHLYSTKTDADRYLLALLVEGRTVWVSIPGDHCAGVSNGTFTGATNLRTDAEQALAHGMWPTDPSLTGRCDDKPSATGSTQIPTDVDSVTVCLDRADRLEHVYRDVTLGGAAIASYDSLATQVVGRAGAKARCTASTAAADLPFVARLDAGSGSFVVAGTRSCVLGPGGLALTGNDASKAYDLFTTAVIDRP